MFNKGLVVEKLEKKQKKDNVPDEIKQIAEEAALQAERKMTSSNSHDTSDELFMALMSAVRNYR